MVREVCETDFFSVCVYNNKDGARTARAPSFYERGQTATHCDTLYLNVIHPLQWSLQEGILRSEGLG